MSQSFRVLLVEDDDSLRVCLDDFLASQGWTVHATAFGNEAIQLAQRQRFDFTILDFHLPGTTGLEVFRALTAVRPLPAILMSGLATPDDALAATRAGIFTFLRKPLDLARLRQSVQLLIEQHFGGPLGSPRHPRFQLPAAPAVQGRGVQPLHPSPGRRPNGGPNRGGGAAPGYC